MGTCRAVGTASEGVAGYGDAVTESEVSEATVRVEGPGAAILAAGHRLVGAKGADFTIVELCREADVALQTFYRYFGSKDQLLVALIGDQIS